MPTLNPAALACLGLTAVAPIPAQGLDLEISGGSVPGTLTLSLSPVQVLEGAVIAYSANPGPTPLSLLHPACSGSLGIGTDLLQDALVSTLVLGGAFQPGPLAVPNLPSIVDRAFHFQGITFPGFPCPVLDRSRPVSVWFGTAGTFRDRLRSFQNARAFHSVLPRGDGTWMVAGGGIGALLAQTAQQDTEVYEPATDTFSPGPMMVSERSVHTTTRLQDGRWLLAGGVDRQNDPQPTCEIYDPVADTFSAVAPMVESRMGHTASLLPDGRVLVAGGMSDLNGPGLDPVLSTVRTTEIYDPIADQWLAGPNLRTPRAGHVAITLSNGDVLFAGGVSYDVILILQVPTLRDTTDRFSVVSGTISGGPRMNADRVLPNVAPLGGGRYLVSGGISNIVLLPSPGAFPTASAEVFDENANAWTATGSMGQARGLHEAFDLGGGRILVAGGADGDVLAPVALASSEIYDSGTGVWSPGPALNTARAAFGAFVTPTGTWQLLGGGTGATGGVTNSHETYYR